MAKHHVGGKSNSNSPKAEKDKIRTPPVIDTSLSSSDPKELDKSSLATDSSKLSSDEKGKLK